MQNITITAQQACDAAKTALEKAPSFSLTPLKAVCDKACEGLEPCELPAATDDAESGFEQDPTHFDDWEFLSHRIKLSRDLSQID